MRLVFAGTPEPAVPSLRMLAESAHDVVAAITRRDAPIGRKRVITPSPVAIAAESLGIPTIKTDRLDASATEQIAALAPDLGVIVAYGGLVREPLLSAPRLGWINLHFSLLPRWRGAAPVQRAIMAGDDVSGVSVFQLVPELDAGELYAQVSEPIGRLQTAGSLLDQLAITGASVLLGVVDALAAGTATATPQAGEVTLAPKLSLADGLIDFNRDADAVVNHVRGVTPEPGAFTNLDGARLKVLDVHVARDEPRLQPGHFAQVGRGVRVGTASDPIELVTVLPAGKKAMAAADWWRGRSSDTAVAE